MTSTLHISADHIAKLQAIAEQLGYVADRGAASGKGSASKLMRALAEGELTLVKK